jgi:hypothetical protein
MHKVRNVLLLIFSNRAPLQRTEFLFFLLFSRLFLLPFSNFFILHFLSFFTSPQFLQDASKQWKDASPQQSWKHASITAPPEYMPEPYNDLAIRECQMPLRRMG